MTTIKRLQLFLLIIIPIILISVKVNSQTLSEEEYKWIYSTIEEFSKKGLIETKFVEIIKSRKDFSKLEWAYIINTLIKIFNYNIATKDDLVLLDKLIEEFKYELLLIKLQGLDKEIEWVRKKPEIGGKLQFTFDVYSGDLPFEKEEFGKIPTPSKIGIKQQIELFLKINPTQDLSTFIKFYPGIGK